jgi:WD40 repeat protein
MIFKLKIFYYFIIITIKFHFAHTNLDFDFADIIVYEKIDEYKNEIKAFKSFDNNEIIQNRYEQRYSQLEWVSIGYPRFIKNNSTLNDNSYIHYKSDKFYMFIETLSLKQALLIAKGIHLKYELKVKSNQIHKLPLFKFECKTLLKKELIIKGSVNNFNRYPLKLEFNYPENSLERIQLEKNLNLNKYLNFNCELASINVKKSTNKFKLNQQNFKLFDKLFGNLDSCYVTRNQLNIFSKNLYNLLNIINEYYLSEYQFREIFVDDLITQISDNDGFKQILLENVNDSLSNYSLNFHLTPKLIINKSAKIFQTNKKSKITFNKIGIEELKQTGFLNQDNKLFNEFKIELFEISNQNENDIQWRYQGQKLVIKSINVAHIFKSRLSDELIFNRIQKITHKAKFTKNIFLSLKTDQASIKKRITTTISPSKFKDGLFNTNNSTSLCLAVLDLNRLASGTSNNEIIIWNLNNGKIINTLKMHSMNVYCLTVFSNNLLFASGSQDKTIVIWNATNYETLQILKGHNGSVNGLVGLSNHRLASCSSDKTIIIWNLNDNNTKTILKGHTSLVNSLVVLNDHKLASCSDDKTIIIWNTETFQKVKVLEGHTGYILALVSLSNDKLASSSADKTVIIWAIETGEIITRLTENDDDVNDGNGWIWSLATLSDNRLACGSSKKITIWNTTSGKKVKKLEGHINSVFALSKFNNDRIISSSADKTIRIWSLN